MPQYECWAVQSGQRWAEAVVHRCHALLAADEEHAERHFETAVRHHEAAGEQDQPFDRGRTHLLYGEWLRRMRRRVDARTHLTAAHAIFERLDNAAWADRAAAELRATGQTIRRCDPTHMPRLTPQELHIVRLAAEGDSNKQIAAQLFLSPRTVGYHLSNAFPKLGVSSRRQLMRLDLNAVPAAT